MAVLWILLFGILIISELMILPLLSPPNCWLQCKVAGRLSCDTVQEQTKLQKHGAHAAVTAFVLYMNAS